MNDYFNNLNPEQKNAVQHIKGPLMVIAGPGSGKTRVLTCRIANLINTGIPTPNILALTFTNKAAKEMQKRIEEIAEDKNTKNLWMGTFHSIFSKILRIESERLNYISNFTIYDSDDSKSVIRDIIKVLDLDKDLYRPNIIQKRISMLKNNFIDAKSYPNHKELIEDDKISKRNQFEKIFLKYEQRCIKAQAMDFDDLLVNTCLLFQAFPDVLEKYQKKFHYILIDEYQDTNRVQYLIIKQLANLRKNICIVGDDAQSIYSFRGADIQNILDFKSDYPDYKTYKLEQNYRSTGNIVKTANSIIQNNENQIKKTVWTSNEEGAPVVICKTTSDNDEAQIVSNTIFEIQISLQKDYKAFAILYRTNAQSRVLEEKLRKKNMPYKIYGGVSFYQRKEIKDILAYFRLIINHNDDEALKRIINYPRRGIGNSTLQKLINTATQKNLSIWDIIKKDELLDSGIKTKTRNNIQEFIELVDSLKIIIAKENAYTSAQEIIKKSGIFTHLYNDKTAEGIGRSENMQELLNGIQAFYEEEDETEKSLIDFIKDVALFTNQDNEKESDYNKITLMTIHSAKGLEFPYVFIVGMEENLFPSIMNVESKKSLEEERRLFYVGVTRAQKRLFLSFATKRFRWGELIESKKSRFLHELDQRYTESLETEFNKSSEKNYPYKKLNNSVKNYKIVANNYKPIKTEKNIKSSPIEKFKSGMIVRHNRFGTGKIASLEGDLSNKKATVIFNKNGKKTLLLKFAKLEII